MIGRSNNREGKRTMAIMPRLMLLRSTSRIVAALNVERCWSRDTNESSKRRVSTDSGSKILEHLGNRSLIRIGGDESSNFLQGLITNDMRHFDDGAASIYTLFLNTKGRVMYDSIIYKTLEKSIYYIECDARITRDLEKHLKMYKVRRKVEIDSLENEMKIWSTFEPQMFANEETGHSETTRRQLEGQIFPCGTLSNKSTKLIDDIAIYEDPRIPHMNLRILSNVQVDEGQIVKHLGLDVKPAKTGSSYRQFRYRLGIGEGIDDLPVGKALPLEANCDYLHGVSFHKGCYIGQELTARTHHTGVVRKRLMPLTIENSEGKNFNYDDNLVDETGKIVGKFRGLEGSFGLGLVRISEALAAQTINIFDSRVFVSKPRWWPKEPQQDQVTADTRK